MERELNGGPTWRRPHSSSSRRGATCDTTSASTTPAIKRRTAKELSTREIEGIYPLLETVSADSLIMTGGEPFLRKDLRVL